MASIISRVSLGRTMRTKFPYELSEIIIIIILTIAKPNEKRGEKAVTTNSKNRKYSFLMTKIRIK